MTDKPTYQELEHRVKELEKFSAKCKRAEKELNFEGGTDRKKTEETLRETRDYLENLINYANAPIIVWDRDFKITRFNNAFEKLTGRSSQEVVGQKLDILFPETSCNDSLMKIGKTLQGEKWESVEIPILRSDKNIRIALWNSANIYGEDGNTYVATIAQGQDITDRIKTEETLRETAKYLENLINYASAPIVVWDRDFKITRFNNAFEKLTGRSSQEVVGQKIQMLFPSKYCDESLRKIGKTLAGDHWESMEIPILCKDGDIKTVLWNSANIYAEDDKTLSATIAQGVDITERLIIYQQLIQARKMEAIGTLAGGIAHDFNNILSAIIGFSELAKDKIPPDNPAGKDIDRVIQSSRRAADLVQQILAFSRKAGQQRQLIQPHLIIKEALKMLRASLPTTLSIEEHIDTECGLILADPTNVHQIVMNLCTNAYHAMENEKGTLTVTLCRKEIRKEDIIESDVSPGPFIVLSIRDTGHGMDKKTMERIFDPYFTTKEVGKGTGLGLAVLHGVIKDCKGFIQVESALGKGTTFHVYIPALEKAASISAQKIESNDDPRGTEKILVVDDESLIVNLNKSVLEQLGYTVTATTNSEEALGKIRTHPDDFDLVITDQTMPNLSGVELAQEILKVTPDMPIILCSGYSSVITQEGALAIGIKKYASKPVDRKTLAKIVRQVLDEN